MTTQEKSKGLLLLAITALAMLISLGLSLTNVFQQLHNDLFWQSNFHDFQNIGENCKHAVQDAKDFSSARVAAKAAAFTPSTMPYRGQSTAPSLKLGQYLITHCQVEVKDFKENGWINLGPLFGPTQVWIDDHLAYASGEGGTVIELPLYQSKVKLEIIAHAQNHPFPGAASLMPLLYSHSKKKLDQAHTLTQTNWISTPLSHSALALGLALMFCIAWIFGIRYSDVSWIIILCASAALWNYLVYLGHDPGDGILRKRLHAASVITTYLSIPAFIFSFFRIHRFPTAQVYAAAVISYSVACILVSQETFQQQRMYFELPCRIAATALVAALAYCGWEFFTHAQRFQTRRKRIHLILATGVISLAAFLAQDYLEGSSAILAPRYAVLVVTAAFAAITGYDLVIYRERLLQEKSNSQVNQAIAQTTQMLSHDIRRPLQILESILSLVHKQTDPTQLRQEMLAYAPSIEKSMHTIHHMLEDVVEINRTSAEHPPCSLYPILKNAIQEAATFTQVDPQSLQVDLQHSLQPYTDPHRLQRALSNILINAIQANRGEGFVRLKTYQTNDQTLSISIHNSESFIEEKDRQHIFEPLFTKGKKSGTGLGLAIVKKIVEEHHGTIQVTSDEKTGTTFTLEIPVSHKTDRKGQSNTRPDGPLIHTKIILIDDDPFIADLWQPQTFFANPQDFLSDLAKNQFSSSEVFVTDLHFDEGNLTGADLAKKIRGQIPDAEIILSTNMPVQQIADKHLYSHITGKSKSQITAANDFILNKFKDSAS